MPPTRHNRRDAYCSPPRARSEADCRIHHAVADPGELGDEIVEVAVGRVGANESAGFGAEFLRQRWFVYNDATS